MTERKIGKSTSPRILIVEDSPEVSDFLSRGLSEEGYEIGLADCGEVAFRLLDETWDLVILDLMLGDISGETILKYLAQKTSPPVSLVLTSRGQIKDKISLFDLGCDDYLTKPFEFDELLRRVRALLRRSPRVNSELLEYEDLKLDPASHALRCGSKTVTLTQKEFAICRLLMSTPGHVITREELLQSVWGSVRVAKTNFIEVHLNHLRRKMEQVAEGNWVHTVRSSGIFLQKPADYGSQS